MKVIASLVPKALLVAALFGCGGSSEERAPARPNLLDAPAEDVSAEGLNAAAELELPDEAPTVAFLGDSIGAGLHLAEHQAFPAIARESLAAEGLGFRLINASESGRTTSGGATALPWVMRSKPDLVVIELGGNDGLRGVPIEDIEKNLRTMIDTAEDGGAEVLLLGVRLPRNYGDYGKRFDALYPRLAEELDLAFLPFFMEGVGGNPELNLADGLHPTAAGHERLARNVLPALREALEKLAAVER